MASELTDIESVRQFMQKSLSDKLQDEDLEILILQASEGIERHCNRQFTREDAQTKSFEFSVNKTGLDLIDLKPYEYRVLKEAVLDPDLTPVTLSAYQYRLWPYPSREGTYFGLRLAETPETVLTASFKHATALPYQTRRIDIKADWGTAAVPKELQHWTNVTVEAWAHLRREGGAPNETSFGEGPLPVGYDLPLPVKYGLRRWQRPQAEA